MILRVPTGLGFLLQPGYIPDFGDLSFFPINFLLSSKWFKLAFYILQKGLKLCPCYYAHVKTVISLPYFFTSILLPVFIHLTFLVATSN